MHWNISHQPPAFPASHYQEKACLSLKRIDRGGAGFCRGAPLSHIDQSECWRKNFDRIFGKFRKLGWDSITQQVAEGTLREQKQELRGFSLQRH